MFTNPTEKLTEDYITGDLDGWRIRLFCTFKRSLNSSRPGCSKWAAWPRNGCGRCCGHWSKRNPALVERVIAGDGPMNHLHIEIDGRCFKLLALYQPMAVDLRAIVSAVKINTDMERVGDFFINIAEAVRRIFL